MEIITRDGYVWCLYDEVPQYLNSEDVNYIQTNMRTLETILTSKGYTVQDITTITVLKSTPFAQMFDILQNIEYNLDKVNSTGLYTPYYVEPKKIGKYAPDKNAIWRWIQTLNDLFDILTGVAGQWGYLLCTDGYPTIDGNRLLLRGDLIG
jgi:hypothetical protein